MPSITGSNQIINWWRYQVTADRALQWTEFPSAVTRGGKAWQLVTIRLVELDATLSTEMEQLLSDFRAVFPQLSPIWTTRKQEEVNQA